ncbi:MAG TPA: RDD family protein [Candidatus Sulfotelmatobacter sp.]|nr:RDD family protein [Candidatus Sulfotelmatobacter sp.]
MESRPPDQMPPSAWARPVEPEGPAPGVAFGGAGERLLAYLIDGLVVLAANIGLFLAAIALVILALPLGLLVFLAIFVVDLAYFPYFWATRGQTPGMRPFQLYVVRDRDGGPITTGQAILRLIGYWIDGVVFYLGYIWILIDSRKRGWHDLIAGTVVIKRI